MILNCTYIPFLLLDAFARTFQTTKMFVEPAVWWRGKEINYWDGALQDPKRYLRMRIVIKNANMDQIFRKSTIAKHTPAHRFDLEVEG